MLKKRASGILLHITSLPSEYGIGDLGPQAYKFADMLESCGQNYWQILPLNYTTEQAGHSPYNCRSAFAGNPLLISPEFLYRDGLLVKSDLKNLPIFSKNSVEYSKVNSFKDNLLKVAFDNFTQKKDFEKFEEFRADNIFWLDDFSTFMALIEHFEHSNWNNWPKDIRDRKGKQFEKLKNLLDHEIRRHSFYQYLFFEQWKALKNHCSQKGIKIIGDIPIYVVYNSADVWANQELFKLDRDKKAEFIAGVPPDYFSETGQLWGNPIYDWQVHRRDNYKWWMGRIKHNLNMQDMVRIDHFRGFVAYWQVPADQKTAINGQWIDGPGDEFFKVLLRYFPSAGIIAEDLGYITADVRETILKFKFPAMKVLQFGFDGNPSANTHIPHNHVKNSIAYTGTHDNNTTRGWFLAEASKQVKKSLNRYIGSNVSSRNISWNFIHLAMGSVSQLSIIPMQDILNLPESARMNKPASEKGNWLWRLEAGQFDRKTANNLLELTKLFGRD